MHISGKWNKLIIRKAANQVQHLLNSKNAEKKTVFKDACLSITLESFIVHKHIFIQPDIGYTWKKKKKNQILRELLPFVELMI